MHTEIISVDPEYPEPDRIERAAVVLRAGGLVAFPTETVYGLGANALDEAALRGIFTAKQRPTSDPIIAHIADPAQLSLLARNVPDAAHSLAEAFWPGPLTLILERAATVPSIIAEGMDTVAVRMPAHPVARALLTAAATPVGAPSANTFTRPSSTTAAHVLEDLLGRIDLILDGGPSTIGLESTVLDLTSTPPRILRPGGITLDMLRRVIPDCDYAPRYIEADTPSAAPGQMLRHYSPRARTSIVAGDDASRLIARMACEAAALRDAGNRVAVLVADEDANRFPPHIEVITLGPAADLAAIGRSLFAALRKADRRGVEAVLVRDFGASGLGAALRDRLHRAAEGRVTET